MNLFKKVILSVIALVIGFVVLFVIIMVEDEENLDVDIQVVDVDHEVLSKSELIDLDREALAEEERKIKRIEKQNLESEKMDFGIFFREDADDLDKIRNVEVKVKKDEVKKNNLTVKKRRRPRLIPKKFDQKPKLEVIPERVVEKEVVKNSVMGSSFGSLKSSSSFGSKETKINTEILNKIGERLIGLSIYGDYQMIVGKKIEFVLNETFELKNKIVKENTIIEGVVKSINQRIYIDVYSVGGIAGVYDIVGSDYEIGIFNKNFRDESGEIARNTSDNIEDQIYSESSVTSSRVFSTLVDGARRMAEKESKNDIYLTNGIQVYLKY